LNGRDRLDSITSALNGREERFDSVGSIVSGGREERLDSVGSIVSGGRDRLDSVSSMLNAVNGTSVGRDRAASFSLSLPTEEEVCAMISDTRVHRVPAKLAAKAVFEAFRGSFSKKIKRTRQKRVLLATIGERTFKVKLLLKRRRRKNVKTQAAAKAAGQNAQKVGARAPGLKAAQKPVQKAAGERASARQLPVRKEKTPKEKGARKERGGRKQKIPKEKIPREKTPKEKTPKEKGARQGAKRKAPEKEVAEEASSAAPMPRTRQPSIDMSNMTERQQVAYLRTRRPSMDEYGRSKTKKRCPSVDKTKTPDSTAGKAPPRKPRAASHDADGKGKRAGKEVPKQRVRTASAEIRSRSVCAPHQSLVSLAETAAARKKKNSENAGVPKLRQELISREFVDDDVLWRVHDVIYDDERRRPMAIYADASIVQPAPADCESSSVPEVQEWIRNTEAEAVQPRNTGVEAAQPRNTEAEAAQPRNTEAEAAQPRNTGAEAAQPRNTEAEAAQPRNTGAEAAQPRNTGVEAAQPRNTEAEAAQPRNTGAEAAQPRNTEAEAAQART
jgi:hypothetical protein